MDINTLITAGKIDFSPGAGYTITTGDGFTYINTTPVPEPASIVGAAALGLAAFTGLRQIRSKLRLL